MVNRARKGLGSISSVAHMRLCSALLLLAVLAAVSAPLAAAPRDAAIGDAYLALVVRYHAGDRTAVTSDLASWDTADLEAAFRALPTALGIASEREGVSRTALVATAIVAHLDVVRRAETTRDLDRHLAAGQRLTDLLPVDKPAMDFKAGWYHAAGTVMFRLSKYDAARQQFEMARRLRPGDPAILLALGSAHEIEGTMRLRQRVEPALLGAQSDGARQESAEDRLEQAADLYRAAIAMAPDLYEARLRLARTRYLQGRVDAADAEAGALAAQVTDGHLRYLTLLIGGGISESAGRQREAVDKYRGARALCRGCQSATLALSQILLRMGDRKGARDLVDRLVNVSAWPVPDDPWLDYQMGQWYRIEAMLEQLRGEVPA